MIEDNEFENINKLLYEVKLISQKFDEIATKTGERFNIFSILVLHDSEVRLHSNLISELLNSKGTHGHKDNFLKLFVDVLNNKIENKIWMNTEMSTSKVEVHTGFINSDNTEGGRIDILVEDDKKNAIIIENKIWAGDQEKQLLRYHKYGIKTYSKFLLIYLTLDGNLPSEQTTGDKLDDTQYICISYKTDIINWLEKCLKIDSINQIVKNIIIQYINQLKIYSGQSINHSMREEIINLLSNNIEYSFTISNQIHNLKLFLMEKLKKEIILISNKANLKYDFLNNSFFIGQKWYAIKLYNDDMFEQNICIRIGFESNNFNDLIYGITKFDNKRDLDKNLLDHLLSINSYLHSKEWPVHKIFSPSCWSNNKEVWKEIENNKMSIKVENCIYEMKSIIENFKSK